MGWRNKNRQLDQGDSGAEQSMCPCPLGSRPPEIQPWGCQIHEATDLLCFDAG